MEVSGRADNAKHNYDESKIKTLLNELVDNMIETIGNLPGGAGGFTPATRAGLDGKKNYATTGRVAGMAN